jgi:F0F1-type ATP synthase membrane subunit b/b'
MSRSLRPACAVSVNRHPSQMSLGVATRPSSHLPQFGPAVAVRIALGVRKGSMRGASRNVPECKTPISLVFDHAAAKLQLVLLLVMFSGITISASAQRGADTPDSEIRPVTQATTSPSSSGDSSQLEDEDAEFKLSYSVRQLARLVGLPPKTIFHLCWDLNFFLMLGLIVWKGGPIATNALQERSRSIRRAIEEAQRLSEDAAKRLAAVEKRWAQFGSEIAAIQERAEAQMSNEEQILRARTAEDMRRIMEYSQSEIDRAAQRAGHELKALAADLSVSLARESIQINNRTDEELVKGFIEGLGHQEFAQPTAQPPAPGNRELVART